MNKAEALRIFYEMHDKCKSCLLDCVNPNQPSSQIEEAPQGYQIKMRCYSDNYSLRCLTPIIEKYKLTLRCENDIAVIF